AGCFAKLGIPAIARVVLADLNRCPADFGSHGRVDHAVDHDVVHLHAMIVQQADDVVRTGVSPDIADDDIPDAFGGLRAGDLGAVQAASLRLARQCGQGDQVIAGAAGDVLHQDVVTSPAKVD